MPIHSPPETRLRTKRWNDPPDPDDGFRLLVCRYRPRGVRKDAETWDAWQPNLGPSPELHADFYGKHGPPIGWAAYQRRYLAEMRAQGEAIAALAARIASGERITLLCSSACLDPSHCHRTLLADLVTRRAAPAGSASTRATYRSRSTAGRSRRGSRNR